MTLDKLILEALKHDPNHPAFHNPEYSKFSKSDWYIKEIPKDSVKLASEHKHLSKLHRVITPSLDLIKLGRKYGKDLVTRRKEQELATSLAIEQYTEYARGINNALIHKVPLSRDDKKIHKNLIDHIDRIKPLQKNHHVYSGLGFDPSKKFRKGIIRTPAWTSTSLHPLIARSFGESSSRQNSHIIHFDLPVGYNKGAYIGHVSSIPNEHEFLLKPNQKWQLTNHDVHKIPSKDNETGFINQHIWSVKPHEN